ncbi:hypothetical protein [Thermotoga sp. SG1]|uniref:hypothetical protein n=1 Tax=Thermotoga sp. SG1 TaxID=126739 RepID=UPI000C794906|nr:hypothetical protein [Thermotoga sp. SG1]PLV56273.1 hypothetical protein AS006_06865 [Thermotoga sp. SG1]
MFEDIVRGFQELIRDTKLAVVSVLALVLGFVVEVLYLFAGKYDFLDLDFFAIKLFEETILAVLIGSILLQRKKERFLSLLVFSAFYGMTMGIGFSFFVLPAFVAFMFLFFVPLLSARIDSASTVLIESYRLVFKRQKTVEVFLAAAIVFVVWFIPIAGSIVSNFLRTVFVYALFHSLEGMMDETAQSDTGSAQSDSW